MAEPREITTSLTTVEPIPREILEFLKAATVEGGTRHIVRDPDGTVRFYIDGVERARP
jgi:hypothetical protein